MSGERKKQPDSSLERLRDIRGRKPVRGPKPPKSADPERKRAEAEKVAAREQVRSIILQAKVEYDAVVRERKIGLEDFELELCWQACKQEIKRARSYVSFRAYAERWKAERDASLEQARAAREQQDQQWQAALRRNWESVDQRPERERRERLEAELSEKRRLEQDREAALRREILAEESLRRANLAKEREKSELRAKMQRRGEIPSDDVVASEKQELENLRRGPKRGKADNGNRDV